MTDAGDENEAAQGGNDADTGGTGDLVLQLNFVPQWARTPPGGRVYHEIDGREERGDRRGGDRWSRQGGGGRDRRSSPRPGGGRRDERPRGGPRREGRDAGRGEDRATDRGPRREFGPREDRYARKAPVMVRLLPEQHGLASIVRKVSHSRRAYPLSEIAYIFLSNPEACNVRIEPEVGGNGKVSLFQCQLCRSVSLDPAGLRAHMVARHTGEFFCIEEREGEPPSGHFVCVARCGISGVLLGPPNHHSYATKVQDVYRTRYAGMPFEEYSRRIEVVHDAELVEKWKEESRRQSVYTLKTPDPELPDPVSRSVAEAYILRHLADQHMRAVPRAIVPLPVARTVDDPSLLAALRDALAREDRFPLSLMMSLRAAFRHMHLHVFKVGDGKGTHFVTATPPSPMDAAHAVEGIRALIAELTANPGCTREQVLEKIHPGQPVDGGACRDTLSHLSWLIEKGHVIEFFNGTLAVPLKTGS